MKSSPAALFDRSRTLLSVLLLLLLATSVADAKRYVGTTGGSLGAPSVVTKSRWSGGSPEGIPGEGPWTGSILNAKYKCHGEVWQCPNAKRGKLLAEMRIPGNFGGYLSFKDGTRCRIGGLLAANHTGGDGGGFDTWYDKPPQQAPWMTFYMDCGADVDDGEETFNFIGEASQ